MSTTSNVQVLADALLLTGTLAASTNVAVVNGLDQHTLYINYSPDTDSTNALEVRIDVSPDNGTSWHPYTGNYSSATGAATPGDPVVLTFTSNGTSDQLEEPYFFNVAATQIRVRAVETLTPGDYGNYTATLFSNRS